MLVFPLLFCIHAASGVIDGPPALKWSNMSWVTKEGIADPDANLWADTQDVVAGDGSFSVVISPPSNGQVPHQWKCGQVTSQESVGYGAYAFTVATPTTPSDPNVAHTMGVVEVGTTVGVTKTIISMEMGRFKGSDSMKNSRFTVVTNSGVSTTLFQINTTNTTIWAFDWSEYKVTFSVKAIESFETVPVTHFTWTTPNPKYKPSNGSKVLINAYLNGHQPPTSNQTVKFALKNLTIVPASSVPATR